MIGGWEIVVLWDMVSLEGSGEKEGGILMLERWFFIGCRLGFWSFEGIF